MQIRLPVFSQPSPRPVGDQHRAEEMITNKNGVGHAKDGSKFQHSTQYSVESDEPNKPSPAENDGAASECRPRQSFEGSITAVEARGEGKHA